jgi:hypothetical protein
MSLVYRSSAEPDAVVVDLKDPKVAALLAWLWPGAGHFYQRRFTKGFLFMICIMGTFLYGLGIGRGRTVYASFRPNDFRWQFICQAGVGGPSLISVVQALKTRGGGDPFLVMAERYPEGYVEPRSGELREFEVIPAEDRSSFEGDPIRDGFMAPPAGPVTPQKLDVLGMWHAELRQFFELSTLFTLVAGLLNLLAIYDAFAGPSIVMPAEKDEEPVPA